MARDFCLIRSGRCAAEDGVHPGSGPWASSDSRTCRTPSAPSWSPAKSRDPDRGAEWGAPLARIEGEAAGQVAVGVGLDEEVAGPSLERGDRVCAGGEAQRRLI